jgi:hypothetical protein
LPGQSEGDRVFFDAICQQQELEFTIDGKYQINADKIARVNQPDGLVPETVLNGYLHLLALDLVQVNIPPKQFKIFDTILAEHLREAPSRVPFKPPGSGNKGRSSTARWVTEVHARPTPYHLPVRTDISRLISFDYIHLILP